jgi:YHS domain-containing protein
VTAPDRRQNGYGIMGEFRRDPVCGMPVDTATARVTDPESGEVFCSEYCRETFLWRQASAPRWTKEMSEASRRIAYFSMEMALDERLPTYSGGLGVLAGDMLRSCADLGVRLLPPGPVEFRRAAGDAGGLVPEGSTGRDAAASPGSSRRRTGLHPRLAPGRAGATGKMVPVLMLDTDVHSA